jgi:hypothetical protein
MKQIAVHHGSLRKIWQADLHARFDMRRQGNRNAGFRVIWLPLHLCPLSSGISGALASVRNHFNKGEYAHKIVTLAG